MPYIPGRTFRNPQERGDYDSGAKAVLTDDQLAMIFIRYFLDVYHQTQHPGLLSETPEEALKRLGGTVGLPPEVPNSIDNFGGVTLIEWLEVCKVLRNRYAAQAELKSSIVFDALAAIRSTSENAMAIMGVLPQVPTPDQLADLERNLYWGLAVFDDAVPELDDLPLADDGIGYVIGQMDNSAPEVSELSSSKNGPDIEPPRGKRATGNQEDVDWWRDEEDP
jgi:hypothetical protein